MKTKTVNGITFYRRPPSPACPKGAWFSAHYHTDCNYGYWTIYRTGLESVGCGATAERARKLMVEMELTIKQEAT